MNLNSLALIYLGLFLVQDGVYCLPCGRCALLMKGLHKNWSTQTFEDGLRWPKICLYTTFSFHCLRWHASWLLKSSLHTLNHHKWLKNNVHMVGNCIHALVWTNQHFMNHEIAYKNQSMFSTPFHKNWEKEMWQYMPLETKHPVQYVQRNIVHLLNWILI